jgi:CBS domain containing-hemolysin-like protein
MLSAFFSGSETAFFSLSQVRLRQLQEKEVKKADLLQSLVNDGQRLLSTLLVGNTAVNIWLTSLVTTLFLDWLSGSHGTQVAGVLATVVTTILLLVFGEVTPKAIAASAPESLALFASKPIMLLQWLLGPLVSVLNLFTNWPKNSRKTSTPGVTEDTIKTALTISEEEGALQQENRQMIYGIFASDDTSIGRIMVPREQIVAVPIDLPMHQAIDILLRKGYSRLPVYRGDIDHVVGLIYAKDLLPLLRDSGSLALADVLRPVMRCRPTRKLNQLLQEMRAKRMHLCIVVNELNKTVGLITMEDLLEEIVGDIADEYDNEPTSLRQAGGVASC